MLRKIFRPFGVSGATFVVSFSALLSYIIGLLRDRVIAINFGTSYATDAYNASFLIPDLLFNFLIAGGLIAAFLPVFSEYLEKDKEEAYKIANTLLSAGVLLMSSIVLIAVIFMPQIINTIFHDTPPEIKTDIIKMTRIMLPAAILFTISNSLGNILMNYKHFIAYAISPILYNLGIILGVIFLHEQFGIYSAAIGVISGAALHALIRIADTFFTEYKFKFSLNLNHSGIKKIIKLMIPRTISLIAWQLNVYLFAFIGLKIVEGGVAAYNFAKNIESFAVSLFGIAFSTAVFPYLTIAVNTSDQNAYTESVQKTIQKILFFSIPAATGLLILATPITKLILSGGAFDDRSVALTSLILFFFAFSIPFESIIHILSRAFYARQNTFTPMVVNVAAMFVIAFFTYFIAPVYGIEWFSIGFSIGMAMQMMILAFLLSKHLSGFKITKLLISMSKTIVASGLMAVVIILLAPLKNFIPEMLSYLIQLVAGATSFFVFARLSKSEDFDISLLKKILLRKNQ